MDSAPKLDAIKITDQEHQIGALSNQNTQAAKDLFQLNGVIPWVNLWHGQRVDREALQRLDSLPTENGFICVHARSLLPSDIVNNSLVTAFLESLFPNLKLLQIYARHATTTSTLSLQSSNAIAPLLFQVIIPCEGRPMSMKLNCGGQHIQLTGSGLG